MLVLSNLIEVKNGNDTFLIKYEKYFFVPNRMVCIKTKNLVKFRIGFHRFRFFLPAAQLVLKAKLNFHAIDK